MSLMAGVSIRNHRYFLEIGLPSAKIELKYPNRIPAKMRNAKMFIVTESMFSESVCRLCVQMKCSKGFEKGPKLV